MGWVIFENPDGTFSSTRNMQDGWGGDVIVGTIPFNKLLSGADNADLGKPSSWDYVSSARVVPGNIWEEYLTKGICAFDPEHNVYDNEENWVYSPVLPSLQRHRTCKLCGFKQYAHDKIIVQHERVWNNQPSEETTPTGNVKVHMAITTDEEHKYNLYYQNWDTDGITNQLVDLVCDELEYTSNLDQ
jgi:hypothetical protein